MPGVSPNFIILALAIDALIYIFLAVAFIVPTWFIAKKAGLSPWLSLLCLFPLTGLILFYVLAFAEWNVIPAPAPDDPNSYVALPPEQLNLRED